MTKCHIEHTRFNKETLQKYVITYFGDLWNNLISLFIFVDRKLGNNPEHFRGSVEYVEYDYMTTHAIWVFCIFKFNTA